MSGFILMVAGGVLMGVAIALVLVCLFTYISYKAYLDE